MRQNEKMKSGRLGLLVALKGIAVIFGRLSIKNVPSRKSAGWNIFMGGFVGIISSPSSSLSPAAGHGWGPL